MTFVVTRSDVTANDEQALEHALRVSHLNKQRGLSLLAAVACAVGAVGWPLVFWPAQYGLLRVHIVWFGSTTFGWVWVLGGFALLVAYTFVHGRRWLVATREVRRLQAR